MKLTRCHCRMHLVSLALQSGRTGSTECVQLMNWRCPINPNWAYNVLGSSVSLPRFHYQLDNKLTIHIIHLNSFKTEIQLKIINIQYIFYTGCSKLRVKTRRYIIFLLRPWINQIMWPNLWKSLCQIPFLFYKISFWKFGKYYRTEDIERLSTSFKGAAHLSIFKNSIFFSFLLSLKPCNKRIFTILLGTITIPALFKNKYGFTVSNHPKMRNRADKEKIVDHSAGHNSAECHQNFPKKFSSILQ